MAKRISDDAEMRQHLAGAEAAADQALRNKTTFRQLARGGKFVFPGATIVFEKMNDAMAQQENSGVRMWVEAETPVVPEHDATVDDILGSWRAL